MKKVLMLFLLISAINLTAQDSNKGYSPSITLDAGWVNQLNFNGHIDASYGSDKVSGGGDAGLNIYLPIGHRGNGIELMGGEQSNTITFIPYSPNSMAGDYFIPCFYFTVPIKKVALLFHFGAGIEGTRIPVEVNTYQYINNWQWVENTYWVQYYTRCIDGNVGMEARYYAYKGFYAGVQIQGLYRSQVIPTPPAMHYGGNTYLQIPIFDWEFNFSIGYRL